MTDQTVIVTGAASGIGLACAKLLLARGARVTAFDIAGEKMAQNLPVGEANLHLIAGDVSEPLYVSRSSPRRWRNLAALTRSSIGGQHIRWRAGMSLVPKSAIASWRSMSPGRF